MTHTFYPNQIKQLLRIKSMINEERKLGLDDFNTCEGVYQEDTWTFLLTFKHTEKPGWLRRWYSPEIAEKKIIPIACTWLKNPILNKTSLAQSIWQDEEDSSKLRRRLEQRIERGTLKDPEKKAILDNCSQLVAEIKASLK